MTEKTPKEYIVSCKSCGKELRAKEGETLQCCGGPMAVKGACTCGTGEPCCVH